MENKIPNAPEVLAVLIQSYPISLAEEIHMFTTETNQRSERAMKKGNLDAAMLLPSDVYASSEWIDDVLKHRAARIQGYIEDCLK